MNFLSTQASFGFSVDSLDTNGMFKNWYSYVTAHALGSDDVYAFEKAKNVAIMFGSPMNYISPKQYKANGLLYSKEEDKKIYSFSVYYGFVGEMKKNRLVMEEDDGPGTVEEEVPVWNYCDYHDTKDLFFGTRIYISNVQLPCASPFMVYGMVVKLIPAMTNHSYVGYTTSNCIEFIDWIVGFSSPSRITLENILLHLKGYDMRLANEDSHNNIVQEFRNCSNLIISSANNNPKGLLSTDSLSCITNKKFVKFRNYYYDVSAAYVQNPEFMFLSKVLGIATIERLFVQNLSFILAELKGNLCGVFSFQFMMNLLILSCKDNSALFAILCAYENTFSSFAKFDVAATMWFTIMKDIFRNKMNELTMEQNREMTTAINFANDMKNKFLKSFREKMFIAERYGQGLLPVLQYVEDENYPGYYSNDEYTGITEDLMEFLKSKSIYKLNESYNKYGDKELVLVPHSWDKCVNIIYNTLKETSECDRAIDIWNWPRCQSKPEPILEKVGGLFTLNSIIFVLPTIAKAAEFDTIYDKRSTVIDLERAFYPETFESDVLKNTKVIVFVNAEIMNPTLFICTLKTYINRKYDIIIICDLACSRHKIKYSSFNGLLSGIVKTFKDTSIIKYVSESEFIDDVRMDANETMPELGDLNVEISVNLPSNLKNAYRSIDGVGDTVVFFSRTFKKFGLNEKCLVGSVLGKEWSKTISSWSENTLKKNMIVYIGDTGELVRIQDIKRGCFDSLIYMSISKNEENYGTYYNNKNTMCWIANGVATHFSCCSVRSAIPIIHTYTEEKIEQMKLIKNTQQSYNKYNESKPDRFSVEVRPVYHSIISTNVLEANQYFGMQCKEGVLICPVINDQSHTYISRHDIMMAARHCCEKLDVVIIPIKMENEKYVIDVDVCDSDIGKYLKDKPISEEGYMWQWISSIFDSCGKLNQEKDKDAIMNEIDEEENEDLQDDEEIGENEIYQEEEGEEEGSSDDGENGHNENEEGEEENSENEEASDQEESQGQSSAGDDSPGEKFTFDDFEDALNESSEEVVID